ncbi:hypothetical protein T265_12317 [Opisthorchis viverrini]|uniref:Uncharacterized protein n=1 Tax=Opisthorchis viverrini TaxID=6198 RepID=A0A074ZSR1_OPIVI|nr:hypothetical protein T265_12317 [Opisthorchis viverrini]KER18304.1 hypothetical protein T265_12317 [Opisthorchis viverrini]
MKCAVSSCRLKDFCPSTTIKHIQSLQPQTIFGVRSIVNETSPFSQRDSLRGMGPLAPSQFSDTQAPSITVISNPLQVDLMPACSPDGNATL